MGALFSSVRLRAKHFSLLLKIPWVTQRSDFPATFCMARFICLLLPNENLCSDYLEGSDFLGMAAVFDDINPAVLF